MSKSVLIVSVGESFNTKQPERLIQTLFPSFVPSTGPLSVVYKQWFSMLSSANAIEDTAEIHLVAEAKLPISSDTYSGNARSNQTFPCFVKIETLRKSLLGSVQLYQVGRFDMSRSCVQLLEPAQYVVVKVFELSKAAQTQENPMNEIFIHSRLNKQTGILPLLGCFATQERIFMTFPFAAEGDLFKFLSEAPEKLSEKQIRTIMRGMLQGVGKCHENYVSHRDISLENFLKIGDELLLIDFGLSIGMGALEYCVENRGPVGKTKYMAPELAAGYPYVVDGRKLDIWSLGVTLFMLITQTEPFHVALNADERYKKMVTNKGMRAVLTSWNIVVSNPLMDLLEAMLDPDPVRRLTIQQILNHPWMTEA